MRNDVRKYSWLALLAASLFLSACNTVEGAGKDIEEAGEEIQEEAAEATTDASGPAAAPAAAGWKAKRPMTTLCIADAYGFDALPPNAVLGRPTTPAGLATEAANEPHAAAPRAPDESG